jgi:hypothetical protein
MVSSKCENTHYHTVTGLFWCEGTKISHGYRLDLENKYGRHTIPYTAREFPLPGLAYLKELCYCVLGQQGVEIQSAFTGPS